MISENDIYEPDDKFNWDNIVLGYPVSNGSGVFFSKLTTQNKLPIFIKTPKCTMKNGFVNGTQKRVYADLLFNNLENIEFLMWLETLEATAQKLILENSKTFFENEILESDIEGFFIPVLKVYKGKSFLLRVNVRPNIKIFNENNEIFSLQDKDIISDQTNVVCIIEIKGLRMNTKSFSVDFEMRQCMTVNPDPFMDKCFIRNNSILQSNKQAVVDKQPEKQLPDLLSNVDMNELEKIMDDINREEEKNEVVNKIFVEELNSPFKKEENEDEIEEIDIDKLEVLIDDEEKEKNYEIYKKLIEDKNLIEEKILELKNKYNFN